MANKYANLIGTNLIKDEYTKINTGFDGVDADMKAVESAIENHETAADPHDQYALDTDLATLQTEVTAHKAEFTSLVADIEYAQLTLQNGWISTLYCGKNDLGQVHLYGNLNTGTNGITTAGTAIATLPSGFEPKSFTMPLISYIPSNKVFAGFHINKNSRELILSDAGAAEINAPQANIRVDALYQT